MITKDMIMADKQFFQRLENNCKNEMQQLAEGNLYFKMENGKRRPYVTAEGKECYLSKKKQPEKLNQLIKRKNIENALKDIRKNIDLLERLEEQYVDIDSINGDRDAKKIEANIRKWQEHHGPYNEYREENKIHKTLAGVKVRSKSELIIAMFLEGKAVPYKYEEEIIIDGMSLFPDFKIKRKSDGRLILWEHFGMMDDERYREKNIRKKLIYEENGFRPYYNLIITYGDEGGGIDTMLLERIYEMLLI